MRAVLTTLLASAVVVVAAWLIAGLSGTVTVGFGTYTVQMATSLAVVAVLAIVAVLCAVVGLMAWLLGIPARWRRWRRARRRLTGEKALTRALVALAAGEAGDARRESQRARRLLGDTPQPLLLAANAARLAGNEAEASALFERLTKREDAAFLGWRGLFRQAIAREDWAQASALAQQAERVHPGGAWLREERAHLAVRIGDWRQALRLSGPEAPLVAYATAAAAAETDPAEALALAKRGWRAQPSFVPAALAYARRLRAAGREGRALGVIRTTWKLSPHPDLADFVLAPISDKLARVKEANRLVRDNPAHPESRLLLARVCKEAGLIGEARRHLEAAQQAGMNQRRLWLLLADLEAERGDGEEVRLAQQEALRRAIGADPDPAWRCEHCGVEYAGWLPLCPACHEPGRIQWGPARPRLALPSS